MDHGVHGETGVSVVLLVILVGSAEQDTVVILVRRSVATYVLRLCPLNTAKVKVWKRCNIKHVN